MEQQQISDPSVRAIFQPDPDAPARALVVAGCCGNVGFGKLGQLARLLGRHGVPVVALDLAPAVQDVKQRLADAFKTRFLPDQIMAITDRITVVQGGIDDLPEGLQVGFVFEAIPERLDLKRSFYAAIRKRDPEAYIFSATSGLTSHKLFDGLPGNARCGVLHPFFPHLTNKLWEMPQKGAVTGKAEIKAIRRLFDRLGMTLIPVADVPSFADAIRSAGRENADVILVGELRGPETMRLALQLASYGVQIFATVHTNSAAATIDRFINVFPAGQQPAIRGMLGESLAGIVAQQLLKRADGSGRVAAHEILIGTTAVSTCIRENRTSMIDSIIQAGARDGMQGMDATLDQLVRAGTISAHDALDKALDKTSFAKLPHVRSQLDMPIE